MEQTHVYIIDHLLIVSILERESSIIHHYNPPLTSQLKTRVAKASLLLPLYAFRYDKFFVFPSSFEQINAVSASVPKCIASLFQFPYQYVHKRSRAQRTS